MKINGKIKKVIAKEFLFLLGSIILSVLIFLIWSLLININQNKENDLIQKVDKLNKYKNLPYKLKMFHFLKNGVPNIYNEKHKLEEREQFIYKIKKREKSNQIYDFIKENGFLEIIKKDFYDKNLKEEDFYNKIIKDTKSEKYLNEIKVSEKELEKTKKSLFNKNIYNEEILGICLVVFSVFFILRYLIYGTKWSIKQLKTK
ncbi:hypothetical protein [Polaribacter sp.]|uniref:hypothetical protein n=1 Tax=Polaribacter sp. TaxID=1920175 RepID=UPI003F6A947F